MKTTYKYELGNPVNDAMAPMTPGIHAGVEIGSIKHEILSPSSPIKVLRFSFVKDGMQFRYTEFPVNEEQISKWNFRKSSFEETVARKYRDLGERLKHIYVAITGETRVKLQSNNWDDFCNEYVELIGSRFQGKRFGIKVVYNDRGYLTFPERAVQPFIVPEDRIDMLKINPQYDKVLIPKQEEKMPDSENTDEDMMMGSVVGIDSAEEAPF